jgi:transcriptional regulator with XRE-family HTH domain
MKDKAALWKQVGAFVRARRDQLGLSQNQVRHALGYQNATSVSLIELGKEGVATKRAYAWADVLEVPRDAFFKFVTGLSDTMELAEDSRKPKASARLSAAEEELLASYRRLPAKLQRRLREHAGELEILASAARRAR